MSIYSQILYADVIGDKTKPQLPQLDHILYGTARLFVGNICFVSRDGGKRGEAVRYQIAHGAQLAITRQRQRLTITIPTGTTEKQLIDFAWESAEFLKLSLAFLTGSDGSAIAQTVGTNDAPAAPLAADGGLRQHLEERIDLKNWDDRELIATGAPQCLLWVGKAEEEASRIDGEGRDRWSGEVQAGIAFSVGKSFEDENALLIRYRRALQQAVKQFTHVGLTDLGPCRFGFTNTTKDELTGTELPGAHIRVVGSFQILWSELACEDEKFYTITQVQSGLWCEPTYDTPGPFGDEGLDSTIEWTEETGWTVTPAL